MHFAQVKVLDVANNVTTEGSAFKVQRAYTASFVPTCGDNTAAGTLKIQGSNQIITDSSQPTQWADIPNASSAIASGVGPAIVIQNMCFAYIRAVYTRSSGGSTTIVVNMNYLTW